MTRTQYNWMGGVFAVLIAGWSLIMGVNKEWKLFAWTHDQVGYALIAIWLLIPPIFFWVDWVIFCRGMTNRDDLDGAKHYHDLSRNIWLALVAVLAVLFGVKLSP